ncbi:MAG: S8 family serine peptidase [Anaerolineae bacterium]
MRRILIWLLLATGLVWLVIGLSGSTTDVSAAPDAAPAERFVPGRILVGYRAAAAAKGRAAVQAVGGKVTDSLPTLSIDAVSVPEDTFDRALATLQADPSIAFAERDPVVRFFSPPSAWQPNDPFFKDQWGLVRTGIPSAWDLTRGSPDVVVAVLDTGADANHEDLRGQLVDGYDFVHNTRTPDDDNGHGTHVTGIIAAAANNGLGISGVAPGSRVMPIKVMSALGNGSHFVIAQGIEHALRNNARILNLSMGGDTPSQTLKQAVDHAWEVGALVVAAAGNDNTDKPSYPAAWPNVISVGALNTDDTRAPFSNYGPTISLVAPGVAILSTLPGNRYEAWPGTSMAAPFVSGVAALLWSRNTSLTNAQVRDRLISTTERLGTSIYDPNGHNLEYGYGLVNAAQAVGLDIAPPTPGTTRPTPTPTTCPLPGLGTEEQALLDAINAARIAAGMPVLNLDMRLTAAAERHSQDMAAHNRLTHTGSDGSSLQNRIVAAGYPMSSASELVAGAEPSARNLVDLWTKGSDYRGIVLGTWQDVGIGFVTQPDTDYYYFWTVTLGNHQPSAPLPTPVQPLCPTPAPGSSSPTVTPLPTRTPTVTPTPQGLFTQQISPAPDSVGWVRSDAPDTNFFGDNDTFTGGLSGRLFHGAVQFDLSSLPPNARIQRAQLHLTGRDAQNRQGGTWTIQLLGPDADYGWATHGYTVLHGLAPHSPLGALSGGDIGEGVTNSLEFSVGQILELNARLVSTQRVSFRFDGPTIGNSLFSWDTGHGAGSTQPGPVLWVAYSLDGPPPPATPTPTPSRTPAPTRTPAPPAPTAVPTLGPNRDVTVQIPPLPAYAGWVVSYEARGNHLGDDDMYVGVYEGAQYLGALQFDLSAIPPGAQVNWATLFLMGRSNRYTSAGGDFQTTLLASSADSLWPGVTYSALQAAPASVTLPPLLHGADLLVGPAYFYLFDPGALSELGRRAGSTRRLSFRLEGPAAGADNLFSWNSGADGAGPILTVNYSMPAAGKRPNKQ